MSRVRNRNTGIELSFRKALWAEGLRYRLRVKIVGNPDIVFPKHRLAVFVDGCYWHGCPEHGQIPKTNREFWQAKIARNVARDKHVNAALVNTGWRVLRIWQHEVKKNLSDCVRRVKQVLNLAPSKEFKVARRPQQTDAESLRKKLLELILNFGSELKKDDLRGKVIALVPAHYLLRDLGSSLIPAAEAASARDRIRFYLCKYPRQVIKGDELMVVSGIGEWARRVRELRVQFGWSIATGVTAKEMVEQGELDPSVFGGANLRPDDYVLLDEHQDREAAYRWNKANEIRKKKASVKDKILEFLLANLGQPVTGEELRYVANDKTEWAKRVRELRTEEGWAVATKTTGRPDLPVGVYVLEDSHQAPPHDRKIPADVRREALSRDKYACTKCGWHQEKWNKADPRHLELHHVVEHVRGGANTVENLITLCTVCHDKVHRKTK